MFVAFFVMHSSFAIILIVKLSSWCLEFVFYCSVSSSWAVGWSILCDCSIS